MPTLFKVVVDSVVRNWLSLTVEDEEVIQYELEHAVGWILGVFYEYDSLLGSREPEWIQGALSILIGMFWRIRLASNVAKSKITMCQLGAIGPGMSEEIFYRSSTGEGETKPERMRRKMPCPDHGVEMKTISMKSHSKKLHGTDPDID